MQKAGLLASCACCFAALKDGNFDARCFRYFELRPFEHAHLGKQQPCWDACQWYQSTLSVSMTPSSWQQQSPYDYLENALGLLEGLLISKTLLLLAGLHTSQLKLLQSAHCFAFLTVWDVACTSLFGLIA